MRTHAFTLDDKTARLLKELARRDGRNRSEKLRAIIRDAAQREIPPRQKENLVDVREPAASLPVLGGEVRP